MKMNCLAVNIGHQCVWYKLKLDSNKSDSWHKLNFCECTRVSESVWELKPNKLSKSVQNSHRCQLIFEPIQSQEHTRVVMNCESFRPNDSKSLIPCLLFFLFGLPRGYSQIKTTGVLVGIFEKKHSKMVPESCLMEAAEMNFYLLVVPVLKQPEHPCYFYIGAPPHPPGVVAWALETG